MLRYYLILQRQWFLTVVIFTLLMGVTILHSTWTRRHHPDPSYARGELSASSSNPNLVFGGLFSLMLAASAAISVDRWQRYGVSAARICQQLGYPLLGVIPVYPWGKNSDVPIWIEDSSLGLLQSNLGWVKKTDRSPHLVVISSLQPQEGKSTIAANLAAISARMQGRVLLVDANFRSPRQHQIWQINNEMGLSTILAGTSQLAESIVEVTPKLELLPTGILANSSELLWNTDCLSQLFQQLRQIYDVVIFDTPALSTGNDANLLSKLSDGLVIVVQPDRVRMDVLTARQSYLDQADEKILGIVINALDRTEKLNFVTERALVGG